MKEEKDKCKKCEWVTKIYDGKYYCMFPKCIKKKAIRPVGE